MSVNFLECCFVVHERAFQNKSVTTIQGKWVERTLEVWKMFIALESQFSFVSS
jgi:hypothetical protein